jgi:myo-inositol-1(or 4)-monophosphatase
VIQTKSSPIDLVTDVDHACDALILERILRAHPDDEVLTEETGTREGRGASGVRWVVDPLDGTTNYAHGFPHFAVSIGIELHGEGVAGVVYDPMRDEMFSALREHGAFLNGEPIRVSRTAELARAMLATGFAYDVHTAQANNIEPFVHFLKRVQAIRRAGSAALDLAYVAAGRFDGFWELHLSAWDVAAGLVLVGEAGGRATDFAGGPASSRNLVASNGLVHDAMLAALAQARTGAPASPRERPGHREGR